MKAKKISELRELLRSEEFAAWYRRYNDLGEHQRNAEQHREDILAQVNMLSFKAEFLQNAGDETLFRAAECEDASARALAEFSGIENDSFDTLSGFEIQRMATTEVLGVLHLHENNLEEHRRIVSDKRAELEAIRKRPASPERDSEANRLSDDLSERERRTPALARAVEEARATFERKSVRRDELWVEVEDTWGRSFRANMARTEYAFQSRRVRREAEAMFARAEAERIRLLQLNDEVKVVESRIEQQQKDFSAHLEIGRKDFDCALINEFLYWPRADDVQGAICVPLIDEAAELNIQVTALGLYHMERAKGLDLLEPVPEETDGMDDPRLDSFFLEGRPGTATMGQPQNED